MNLLASESVADLLTSVPHWIFELVSGLVYAGIGAVAIRPLIRRHDRRYHADQ